MYTTHAVILFLTQSVVLGCDIDYCHRDVNDRMTI